MRLTIGLLALTALAACGANKSTNNASANAATNGAAANAVAPAPAPAANGAAANVASGGSPITPRPVLVGVDPELDKCPSTGRSSPTRPLVVRTAPNAAAAEADTITRALNISICDTDDRENPQANWFAIVYPAGGDQQDCGLDAIPASPGGAPYTGPCKSGWVRATDIEVIAG